MNTERQQDAKIIGKNISIYLSQKGKTQQSMANALEVDISTISTWVNGRRIPRLEALKKIAEYLEVPLVALLTAEDAQATEQLLEQYYYKRTQPDRPQQNKETLEAMQQFGRNISELLKQQGKEQKDLANALGVGEGAVSSWVHGRRFPRIKHIKQICQFLEIPQSALLDSEFFENPGERAGNCLFENIRRRRQELDMTQQELAEKCGYIGHSSIAKIENGDADITSSKIVMFADALKTTPAELMRETRTEGMMSKIRRSNLEEMYDVLQIAADRIRINPKYRAFFKAAAEVNPDDIDCITRTIKRISQRHPSDQQEEQDSVFQSMADKIRSNPAYIDLFRAIANAHADDIEPVMGLIKKNQIKEIF